MRKAVFEAQDTHPIFSVAEEGGEEKYNGPERRMGNRRGTQDRRGEVRFDLNASDRRESAGRRHDDKSPNFW